jgi:acylphosphatase
VKRLRVLVSGTVQGVWFRESTRQEADRLGVAGWVRNLPDGRVEAAFEGPAPGVEAMVAWCHHGPRNAAVDHVEAVAEEPMGERGPFQVLRETAAR